MFNVKLGEEVDAEFVYKIRPVDVACYKEEYQGVAENSVIRFTKNQKTFVFVCNENDDVVGYINFFPCEENLYRDIISECDHIRDDEILPEEVAEYNDRENHIYILSVAIHPDYQGTEVIKIMTKAYEGYLEKIEKEGLPITDITASAVSSDGIRFLERCGFSQYRELPDGNRVFMKKGR